MATVSDAGPAPIHAMRDPFFFCGALRQQVPDLVTVVRGHAFQATNRNGFAVHSFRGGMPAHTDDHTYDPRIPGKTLDSRFSR